MKLAVTFTALLLAALTALSAADTEAARPNVLFILADDLCYGDLTKIRPPDIA